MAVRSIDHYEKKAGLIIRGFLKGVSRIERFSAKLFELQDLIVFMQQRFRARFLFRESKLAVLERYWDLRL